MRFTPPSLLLTGILVLLASACDKKDDDTPRPGTPAVPTPDATFTASMVDTYYNGTAYTAYGGSALVKGPSWQGIYIGDIWLNGLLLDTLYGSYHISSNDVPQLNLSSGQVSWSSTGGNGFIPFTQDVDSIAFPNIGQISSVDTVHKSAGYVYSVASVDGADSVVFNLLNVRKTLAGNVTSCTFTASDLANLPYGNQYVSIAATTYIELLIGDKRCIFKKSHSVGDVVVVVD